MVRMRGIIVEQTTRPAAMPQVGPVDGRSGADVLIGPVLDEEAQPPPGGAGRRLTSRGEWRLTPPAPRRAGRRPPCGVRLAAVKGYPVAMIHDLVTAFLVAFAAVTASELLTRIWESL